VNRTAAEQVVPPLFNNSTWSVRCLSRQSRPLDRRIHPLVPSIHPSLHRADHQDITTITISIHSGRETAVGTENLEKIRHRQRFFFFSSGLQRRIRSGSIAVHLPASRCTAEFCYIKDWPKKHPGLRPSVGTMHWDQIPTGSNKRILWTTDSVYTDQMIIKQTKTQTQKTSHRNLQGHEIGTTYHHPHLSVSSNNLTNLI